MADIPLRALQRPDPQQWTDNELMNLPEAAGRRSEQDGRGRAHGRRLTDEDGGPVESGGLEGMAAALEASGRYRIVRRLEPRAAIAEPDGTPTRRGIFLDVETTGLAACRTDAFSRLATIIVSPAIGKMAALRTVSETILGILNQSVGSLPG